MANGSNNQMLWAAVGVALAIFGGSFLVANALDRLTGQIDRATGRLDKIEQAVASAKNELGKLASARPAAAPPRKGPDPNKRYSFKVAGSPALGPDTALVKIVEFSDFQ